MSEEDVECIRL